MLAVGAPAAAGLVNPLSGLNFSAALPVGIASYGLSNMSGDSGPYQIATNEIVGFAKINKISAYNGTPSQNYSEYGASLQLNTVMKVNALSGRNYTYWLQNVITFNTSNHTYNLVDNVWNMSNVTANLSNQTVFGRGNVTNSTYYAYGPNETVNYTLPVYFIPIIKVELFRGLPIVRMGYAAYGAYQFYDNLTFNISASSAYMLVTPYYNTPVINNQSANSVNFYDSELVFGGGNDGELATFSNTNATLWMGYLANGTLHPFPAVGIFGSDTAEQAEDLASYGKNGNATVAIGEPNYNETIRLSGVPTVLQQLQGTVSRISNSSVRTQPNSAPNGGAGGSPPPSGLSATVIGVVLILMAIFLLNRIARGNNNSMSGPPGR